MPDYVFSSNGDIEREDEVAVGVDRFVARGTAFGGATITVFVLAARSALRQRLVWHKRKRAAKLVELEPIEPVVFKKSINTKSIKKYTLLYISIYM